MYYETLVNPSTDRPLGPPDMCQQPTQVVTLISRYQATMAADAVDAAIFTSGIVLYPGVVTIGDLFNTSGVAGIVTSTAAISQTDNVSIAALYGQYRPVSCSLSFEPTQSLTTATGKLTLGYISSAGTLAALKQANLWDNLNGLESRALAAVTSNQMVLWAPTDADDADFLPTAGATLGTLGTAGAVGVGRSGAILVGFIDFGSSATTAGAWVVTTVLECTSAKAYDFLGRSSMKDSNPIAQANALNRFRRFGHFRGF